MAIFDQLYSLHARLMREAESLELMVGDGILTWSADGDGVGIHHPLLLSRLQLHFDPQTPEFTVYETEYPPEMYTALLLSHPEANSASIGHCRKEFERDSIHPLGAEETSQFLQRLVYQLSPRGEFSTSVLLPSNMRFPLMSLADPVLFFCVIEHSATIRHSEAILEHLPTQQNLSYALLESPLA